MAMYYGWKPTDPCEPVEARSDGDQLYQNYIIDSKDKLLNFQINLLTIPPTIKTR